MEVICMHSISLGILQPDMDEEPEIDEWDS